MNTALASFRCCKDKDIETFLHEKAIDFLKRGWCAVYLILDEQEFDRGHLQVDAYFTLSHKTLISSHMTEAVSKSKIRTVSGVKDAETLQFVLIGQLGKRLEQSADDKILAAEISASEILDFAFDVIRASDQLIPCRCVLVECSDNEKVQKVYLDYNFAFFQNDGIHCQYFKRI